MNVPLWVWVATVAGIAAMVGVDVWHARRPHTVAFREAVVWSLVYITAAIAFGVGVVVVAGREAGEAFFAGYLVEKTLSVDNLFVFAVILTQFAVPARHQQKALLYGVLGALMLRAAFIAAGAVVIERFTFTFVVFGAFLIWTAIHLLRSHGQTPAPGNNRAVRLLRRVVPVGEDYGEGTLLRTEQGRRVATPLLVVVVAILSVDIVFALDSIPAIFGITESPYLVFTTNAFALLGLRALYFLLVGLLDRLVHLHYGLATVLAFIGVKLILHWAHTVAPAVPQIATGVSLAVVLTVFAITTATSLRAAAGRPRPPSLDDAAAATLVTSGRRTRGRDGPCPGRPPEPQSEFSAHRKQAK